MAMTEKRIAVLGATPISTIVSAQLARRGIRVDLFDTYNAHTSAIMDQGYIVNGSLDIIAPASFLTANELTGLYDIVFLFCSPFSVYHLFDQLPAHLHEDSIVCVLQPFRCDLIAPAQIGKGHLVTGVVNIDADWYSSGVVNCLSPAQHMVYGRLFELSADKKAAVPLNTMAELLGTVGSCSTSFASA